MAILASALVTLPAALSADVAVNIVNTADQGPLNTPRPSNPEGDASVPAALGATGATPHDTTLSPQLVHNAGNQTALSNGLGTTSSGQMANLPRGPLGIPGVVLDAYLHAQNVLGVSEPGCHLPWWLLAGIGKIESSQAENGEVDTNGTTLRPILGPELNGGNGFAALPAINGGQWTGDAVWQRAVGPMQFLPSTWLEWGNGGNPNNVYDAALAAGRYLCADGRDLSQPAQQAAAVFSYNHSDSYVQIVLVWANAYRNGVTPLPETSVVPQGPQRFGTKPRLPQGGGGGGVIQVGDGPGKTTTTAPGKKPTGTGTGTGTTTTGPGSSTITTLPTGSGSPTSPTSPTSVPPSTSSAPPTTTLPACPRRPTCRRTPRPARPRRLRRRTARPRPLRRPRRPPRPLPPRPLTAPPRNLGWSCCRAEEGGWPASPPSTVERTRSACWWPT